jgi:hypothetical protein
LRRATGWAGAPDHYDFAPHPVERWRVLHGEHVLTWEAGARVRRRRPQVDYEVYEYQDGRRAGGVRPLARHPAYRIAGRLIAIAREWKAAAPDADVASVIATYPERFPGSRPKRVTDLSNALPA